MRHVWLPLLTLLAAPVAARADSFDHYTNEILALVPKKADAVQRVQELNAELITDHAGVLKDSTAAFVIVKTNEDRYCKLLVQLARQKVPGGKKTVPILLV